MEGSLITVVLTLAVAALLIGSMLIASWLAPRLLSKSWTKTRTDMTPYECGARPFEPVSKHRFSVKFYLVAMLFVVFDLEAVFFYPWGALFRELGGFGFAAMSVFAVPLVVGLVYEWKKGALEW